MMPSRAERHLRQELLDSFTNRHLHLILLPTEQCNFRCTYCYEDFQVGRMPAPVVDGVKALLTRRIPELSQLRISWFGGEPLAARDVVEEISEHVVSRVAGSEECSYVADATTNAYLLGPEVAARFRELGIREYQVSLDGSRAHHDRTRRTIGGRGSFERIWQNLLAVRDGGLDVRVTLRVHITRTNLADMPDFLREVAGTFLGDPRFEVFLKPIAKLGGPNDDQLDIVPSAAVPDVLRELETVLYGRPRDPDAIPPHVCYAARPNSYLIRANGLVGKCTVILTDPRNALGRIRRDGSIALDETRYRAWLRGWEGLDADALACPVEAWGRPSGSGAASLPILGAAPAR